jgi:hypothetical protein
MTVKIRQIDSKADRKKFVKMPWLVYKDDPVWVPPLIMDRLETIDPKKNPFFEHAEAALYLAERDGVAVGRISAHINHLHNEYHNDKTGFFGWFESIDDPKVAGALLETAEGWLKDRGCDQVLGPVCWSVNEEAGMLAENREGPHSIMCAYNPPYYVKLLEGAGHQKAKDMFGWFYEIGKIPEGPLQVADAVDQHPGLTIRNVDPKHMERDVRIVRDVFNSAWSKNWGYVPWTEAEVVHSAKMMKMILAKEITAIAEVDGKPAGIMLAFPNINEVIKDLNGKLFPTGMLKLVYRVMLGRYKFKSARLFLLGIKSEFRGSVLGGLSVRLYVEAHKGALKLGMTTGELGWTLEDNKKINAGIEFMGGRIGKVYRIYGKQL